MRESEVAMPKLSMTMEEGEVVGWDVAEGQQVAAGDVVCRVMTDKTEMDVEAPAGGRVVRLTAGEGQTVPVGGTLLVLATEEQDLLDGLLDGPGPSPSGSAGEPPAPTGPAAPRVAPAPGRVASVPAARALARSLGVDIAAVAAGASGVVTVDDVLAGCRPNGGAGGAPAAPAERSRVAQRRQDGAAGRDQGVQPAGEALGGRAAALARATARTMTESAAVPQFTLQRTLDVDGMARRRGRLGWNAIIAAAAVRALRAHPRLNGTWTGTEVVLRTRVVLGLAVDTADGLVVAGVPDADELALTDLASAIDSAVARARRHEAAGPEPTFTISNLGGFGVDWFQALVTPPQAAVLSLGRVRPGIDVGADSFRIRRQCHAGLTVDHRVANGADGARYLATLDELLQPDHFADLALGAPGPA